MSHVSSLECETCQLRKHHRITFLSSSHSRQSEFFNVVPTDIWVLSHTSTLNIYLYFLIFVNDYSRMIWVFYFLFFMKERFELPHIVSKF